MIKKLTVIAVLCLCVFSCANKDNKDRADMYEASDLSALMRDMVEYSKEAKANLAKGEKTPPIPSHFWDLKTTKATRGEHEEGSFLGMSDGYLQALKGIERGDSQQFYYQASIDACKTCHSVYCGGPMSIINKL